MAFVFDPDIDLVPTDIAAGLIVINVKAQVEASQLKSQQTTSSSGKTVLEESSVVLPIDEWLSPPIAHHFMKYALASYGW